MLTVDVLDRLMQGALNKIRMRSNAPVPSPDRGAKSAEGIVMPPPVDDIVGTLAWRYERASKLESKEAVVRAAFREVEAGRFNTRRVDPRTPEGQLVIGREASEHGVRPTARRYGVAKSNVARWAKQIPQLQQEVAAKKSSVRLGS